MIPISLLNKQTINSIIASFATFDLSLSGGFISSINFLVSLLICSSTNLRISLNNHLSAFAINSAALDILS